MDIEIKVTYNKNLVKNGNFEDGADYWIISNNWTVSNGVATIINTGNGGILSQNVSELVDGQEYTLTFEIKNYVEGSVRAYTGAGQISGWVSGNGSYSFSFTVGTSIYLYFQGSTSNNTNLSIDNVRIIKITTKLLDTQYIKDIDNFKKQIEDDLFTFKSDSISFDIDNYESDTYFEPQNFITNSDIIHRLDFNIELGAFTKHLKYFVDNDGSRQIQNNTQDYIEVNGYELSSLFKDNGWFLGDLTQETEEKEAKYKFSTGGDSSLSEITNLIETNTREIISNKNIPLEETNFGINNITTSTTTIEGTLSLPGEILDYYVIPNIAPDNQRGRIFLLIRINYLVYKLFELKNGNELIEIDERNINVEATYDENTYQLGFIHNWSDYPSSNGGHLYIYRYRPFSYYFDVRYYWWRYKFGDTNEMEYNSSGDFEQTTGGFDGGSWARVIDCCDEFLGSGGFHNNMTYISDNNELTVLYEPEPTYIFTPITTGEIILNEFMEPYYTMTYAYADECEYEIYRFSQHLNFVFENITLSDILKELCITQDIVWYLDYTTNGITVTFTDRKDTANWSLLGESDMGSISTKVVKIKFDDLKSQIFPASKERMEDLIGYYNDRYGQGKHKKEIEMFGYQDKDLGNIIKYNSKYWMVEDIEWSIDRIKERTNITMFEIGDI